MKKLLLSVLTIGLVVGVGGYFTNAFFSDTETSTNNTFQAGAIDLLVDNTCYYNGQACTNGFWGGIDKAGNECKCTWQAKNLEEGDLFFDFSDLKPGDWEEDTISLTVDNNDSWLCANVKLTKNDDNSCTEPETTDEAAANPPLICSEGVAAPDEDIWDGELASSLNFMWWVDDGDNVLESDEQPLFGGPVSLAQMVAGQGPVDATNNLDLTLTDSIHNVFGTVGSPIPGGSTKYIAKAFCYGTFERVSVPQNGTGEPINPTGQQGPGFNCDGTNVNNITQTDITLGDLSFYAEQYRNNTSFLCPEHTEG